jgi:hypothetical protein
MTEDRGQKAENRGQTIEVLECGLYFPVENVILCLRPESGI